MYDIGGDIVFVLNEDILNSLNKEDLRTVLETYDSLPNGIRRHISLNMKSYIKKAFNDKIYMYESAPIAQMLDSSDLELVADATFSTLQSQISIIKNKIDECGCDSATINDIKRLCDIECYDLNSYILFDAKCGDACDNIINSSNKDNDKIKAIEIVNIDINKFKFIQLEYINNINHQHIDGPTARFNDFTRVLSVYNHIVKILKNKSHDMLHELRNVLTIYNKITGNSINRFIYQLSIDISPEEELVSESTIDDLYSAKIKPVNIESLGKLTDDTVSDMLCLEESNRLILGDNIFLDDNDRKDVYKIINKMDENAISKIVHDKISFQLNESDCMIIFDNENYQMLSTVIYMSDGQVRYLGKYDGVIYVLFKVINKDKIYGLNIDDKSIIEISNNSENFEYKYDM